MNPILAAFTAGEWAFLMTTLGGVIASIIISLRGNAKVDVVAAHVNSKATASDAEIAKLRAEVAELKSQRSKLENIAALLAQSEAFKKAPMTNDPLPVVVENKPTEPVPTNVIKEQGEPKPNA